MKGILWPCLLSLLAGCSPHQAGTGNPAKPSERPEATQTAPAEKKGVASSADDALNVVTTVPVPEGGGPVAARADAEGTIHLLYNSADGPKYVKSSNNGKTFEEPIPVVDEGSRKAGLVLEGWDMAVGK